MMRYASVCDGIGAAHVAWKPLGFEPAWTSEIDPFPSAVVEHHHALPNLGDMTQIDTEAATGDHGPIDVLVGGTPCQSFSVAGLRRGLADPRGNLALVFLRLLDALRPRWVVWENVPGVLSSNDGRDFGAFLGALAELGYGFAYRVLDAQYVRVESHAFAVPQRRRRVFVVGCSCGDWRRAAAVLLERQSLCGHPAPRREAGEGAAADVAPSLVSSGRGVGRTGETRGQDPVVAGTLNPGAHAGSYNGQDAYAGLIQPVAFDTTQITHPDNGIQPQRHATCHTLSAGAHPPALAIGVYAYNQTVSGDVARTLPSGNTTDGVPHVASPRTARMAKGVNTTADEGQTPIACCRTSGNSGVMEQNGITGALNTNTDPSQHIVQHAAAVRRLTPVECERLQGFPDHYTAITYRGKPAKDTPRYRALGNSMAVNVMSWIGQRIKMVDERMGVSAC